MKALFDLVSYKTSKMVTKVYSTSFSLATRMLGKEIRQDIYNIYGFVRFADEIVDSFHDYNKPELFDDFERQLNESLKHRISLNPVLNAFQFTVHKYDIDREYINAFMSSMRQDLEKSDYVTTEEYEHYIYGSADVVGLMCLKVFVNGDPESFESLKGGAMKLGSAFQKVNFLRDLKEDSVALGRSYFPGLNLNTIDESTKSIIIADINKDFQEGFIGLKKLPLSSRFGVYLAYRYYRQLLKRLENTPADEIINARIRVPDYKKISILTRSYVKYQLNLI